MIVSCDFVNTIFGSSPLYRVFASSAIKGAPQAAMELDKKGHDT